MTLASGTILGTYRVESLLGRGGMGEVYLATHESLGRKVALKLLAPELTADPGFRQRFIAESRLAASLDHPHIVPIYEAGEADGRLFLAMRYVEGADLGAIIARDGPLEPTRALGLLGGIAAALDAAHDRGLVHRDVKPGNILVARTSRGDEHAYLGDFGLVKQLGSDAGFTRSGQLVGSVDYVAPEQIEGRPIDHRVDVYSLACVLYTALAGRPPYERETEMATLWAHVQTDPPQLSETRPELAPLDQVVTRGMAKDPAERYATAGELIAAGGEGTVHVRSKRGVRMHERRTRRFITPAALLVATLLAFVTVVLDASPPGPGERPNTARPGGSPRSLEATRTQASGVPALVEGPIASGRYRTTVFSPSLEFSVPSGWSLVAETADEVSLIRTGAQGQGLFVSRFGRAIDPDAYLKTGQFESVQIVGGSNGAIDWLTGHPYLTVESRRPMLFGDVGGYAVDMRPDIPAPTVDVCALDVECLPLFVPAAGTEPIVPEPGTVIFTVFNSARYRLAFVDAGDQTVAFMIEAERDEDWIAFATSAQSILESVALIERPD